MSLTAGTKLGTYEVTSHIGSGGMGEVYQAHDSKLGRDVAIKVLPEQFARFAVRKSTGAEQAAAANKVSSIFNFFDELRRKLPPASR
jgi:serine/threonine protein kinase